jgi:hypothetical protein
MTRKPVKLPFWRAFPKGAGTTSLIANSPEPGGELHYYGSSRTNCARPQGHHPGGSLNNVKDVVVDQGVRRELAIGEPGHMAGRSPQPRLPARMLRARPAARRAARLTTAPAGRQHHERPTWRASTSVAVEHRVRIKVPDRDCLAAMCVPLVRLRPGIDQKPLDFLPVAVREGAESSAITACGRSYWHKAQYPPGA